MKNERRKYMNNSKQDILNNLIKEPLSALLFLEIIRWESRFQVQLISFRSIMKMEIYII